MLLLLLPLWFLLSLLIVVLRLQLLLSLQDMPVVFVFLFFFIQTADVSSTGIDHHTSGRSPQTSRIYSVAYVATHVSTEQEYPEPETSCKCGTLGGTRKHPNFCDSRNCHQAPAGGGVCHLRDPVRVTPAGTVHRWQMPTVSGKLLITKKNNALK